MGSLFGGGKKAQQMESAAEKAQTAALVQQTELQTKQEAERQELKAEETKTKEDLETRRRRLASGLIGRRSLFTADETGYARPTTLGAS
jgi:hypothetical protein